MEWCNTWTLILLALLLMILYWYVSVPRNLPPGPVGLPLLGSTASIGTRLFKSFQDLGKKYGDIYHMYLGSQLVIVLNDFDVIKEAFVKQGDIFAGRPRLRSDSGFLNDFLAGIFFNEGEFWKQHRRLVLNSFKIFGVGKSTLEQSILDEIHHFMDKIKTHQGNTFNIRQLLMNSIVNTIQILLNGKRSEYSDPEMRYLVKAMQESVELLRIPNYLISFPWAEKFLKLAFYDSFKKGTNVNKFFVKFVAKGINEVEKEFVVGQTDNYYQTYLTEKEKDINRKNIFTNAALINNSRDLLFAGTETTTKTMLWLMTYLTAFPEVQRKAQREIDLTIGRDREPTFNDRVNTPYVEATILETHRFASVTHNGVPRRTVQSTTLRGYNIPEDTVIFSNIWAVHYDPKLWGDPENFRPERFLNADGACVKPEYLIPFLMGKRVCPGEALVKMETYLYCVCLLRQFNFVPPNGVMPSLEPFEKLGLGPKSDLICVEPRIQ